VNRNMEAGAWRRAHGGECTEVSAWRRVHGGEHMEASAWRGGHREGDTWRGQSKEGAHQSVFPDKKISALCLSSPDRAG